MNKRGGSGRGQGRKPIKAGQNTVTVSLRLTVAQRAKLEAIGGAAWVRDRLDRAKPSNAEVSGATPIGGASLSTDVLCP